MVVEQLPMVNHNTLLKISLKKRGMVSMLRILHNYQSFGFVLFWWDKASDQRD
jgi:hypothetical protein